MRWLRERVTLEGQGDSDQVDVTLHWAGGVTSQPRVIRPVARSAQLSIYAELMAQIAALRHAGTSVVQIAEPLHRAGFSPPKRTERCNGGMGARLLSHRGLHGPRPRAMVDSTLLAPHAYWLTDCARRLPMPMATVHKGQRLGWVNSRQVAVAAGRWALWADDDALERRRRRRADKRQWPEPRYPAALTTPKRRDDAPGPCATSCTTARQG